MTEETLFELALNTPAADRAAWLDRECADDPALRARVEALLAAHERLEAASPQERPTAPTTAPATSGDSDGGATAPPTTAGPLPPPDAPPAEGVGALLAGKYKLVQEIGEGGMGAVFMAQQVAPVRRAVAVKVIKAGMDTKAVLARFEAERQALALMDHPNIARVLDAGTTDSGRPFFVMELVKGTPITAFCDERQLTPRQRLELFVPVCQAIQHAHQKGIIHRDIKPSNVLVALHDDRPVPKVIDFGVAKAAGPQLTEQTLMTGFGAVVGTPEYMSPEQASLNNLDIDTRSDVYALGVLLYELLTGTTPVDRKSLGRAAVLEVLRVVREVEPPAPSSRLSTLEALPSIAANRKTEPSRLAALLRGELDWIAMRALEKDRSRRYETANSLARDIQRYLADEVVEARPPSAGYRLRKLLRRHKGQVVAASLVLLALLAGIIGTTWGLVRAEGARQAEARRAEGERLARQEAQQERDKAIQAEQSERTARQHEEEQRKYAEAIANFVRDDFLALTSVHGQQQFGSVLDHLTLNKDTTLRQLLDRAAAKLARRRDLDPRTEAELNGIVGVSYRAMGDATRALPYLERCLALRREAFGRDGELALDAQGSLGVALIDAGRPEEALPLLQETLRLSRSKLGSDHTTTLGAMNNLASAYGVAGRPAEAVTILEELLPLLKARLGPDHPKTLDTMSSLEVFRREADLRKGRPPSEESLRLLKARLGPDHPDTLNAMNNLAWSYWKDGRLDRSIPLFEEALKRLERKLGRDHPATLQAIGNLGVNYKDAGRLDEALPLLEEALRMRRAKLGPDHPDTLTAMNNLAATYQDIGRLKDALPLGEEALRLSQSRLGPDHPLTLTNLSNLATTYQAAGRLDEALRLCEEALRLSKARLGPDHPDTLTAMNSLARLYWMARRLDRSIPLFEEALKLKEKSLGRSHPNTLIAVANLGANYRDAGRLAEALPLFEKVYRAGRTTPALGWVGAELLEGYAKAGRSAEAAALVKELLAAARTLPSRDSPQDAQVLARYGQALLHSKAYAEVEPLLRKALAIREKTQPGDWRTPNTRSMLGGALLGQKKYAEAEPLLLRGYEGMKAREKSIPPVGTIRLAEALDRLVELYTATNRPDEAKKWRAERARYDKDVGSRPGEKK